MADEKKPGEARHHVFHPEPAHFNVSPAGFQIWAKQYYQCRLLFEYEGFSPVPYFLLCRAIELFFKSVHLETREQRLVKEAYWHDLVKSYNDLPPDEKILSAEQLLLLEEANQIYNNEKGFEYFNLYHAVRGHTEYPDLKALDELAAHIAGRMGQRPMKD
jgi:hypothetical protein